MHDIGINADTHIIHTYMHNYREARWGNNETGLGLIPVSIWASKFVLCIVLSIILSLLSSLLVCTRSTFVPFSSVFCLVMSNTVTKYRCVVDLVKLIVVVATFFRVTYIM